MRDQSKTKKQLIEELEELRRQLAQRGRLAPDRGVPETDEHFRLVFEQGPLGMAVIGSGYHVLKANPTLCQMLGCTDSELIGKPFLEIAYPHDREEQADFLKQVFAGAVRGATLETRLISKIQGIVWVDLTATAFEESGTDRFALAMVKDVTARIEADEVARYFTAIVEASDDAMISRTLDGTIISWNSGAERLYGYPAAEIIGRSVSELLPPGAKDEVPALLNKLGDRKRIDQYETVHVRKDGSQIAVSMTISPIRNASGTIAGASTIVRDITEWKWTAEQLRRSEASHRALFENTTLGLYRSSPDGRFLTVNPAIVRMLGYESEEELLAVDVAQDVYVDPEERTRLIEQYRDALEIERVDVAWRRKDGEAITIRLSGRPVRGLRDELEAFEMIAEDVTQQRALEAQLRQSQKMEVMGQLTGGIAHDFNNILTVILANAGLVESSLPPEYGTQHRELGELKAAAKRGTAMVRRLLSFSRRALLTPRPLTLFDFVEELSTTLGRLLPENIEVRILANQGTSRIHADPAAVEQILVNLATNARDAMPNGGLLLIETGRAWLDQEHRAVHGWGEPGEYVCLTVSDTGTGMDVATRQRIFEPFFTTKPAGHGTGLGMAMVYGLAKQHRGFVDVVSEVGEGTTVKVYFPRSSGAVAAPPEMEEQEPQGGTETILLVEDEAPIRRATKRILEKYGYTVLLAADGEEALQILLGHNGDIALVISDLVMPRMSGHELYAETKSMKSTPRFIITSGYAAGDVVASATMDPDVPFLHKPWTPTELLVRVREVLDQTLTRAT